MEKLRFADGTEVNESRLIQDRDLFLYMKDVSFKSAFKLITDTKKTKRIIYLDNGGGSTTFTGYTKPVALRDEGNGLTTAVLSKEG